MHYDWNEVVQSLKSMGEHIIKGELKDIDPIVYCFTGKGGNVASGAVEAFENLPHKWVRLQDLPLLKRKHGPHTCIYGVQLGPEDVFRHRDGRPFGRSHYMKHPAEYESVFATDVAPYITVLVNGMYWDERYPRMLTKQQMHDLYGRGEKSLMVVADISCDVNGSIEFLLRSTTIDHPTFHYDPILQRETSQSAEGITICGVDILPTELPRESSAYFGDQLLPVLEEYIRLKGSGDADALPKQLVGALIAKDGSLTHAFKHLGAFMDRDTGADVSSPAADVVLLMKVCNSCFCGWITRISRLLFACLPFFPAFVN
jgi:alpha-aminoadipic semialdehyde synthase